METTVIQMSGLIGGDATIINGVAITNPFRAGTGQITVRSRVPNSSLELATLKVYDGILTTSSGEELPVIKTESIDGITVKTYQTRINSTTTSIVDVNGDRYYARTYSSPADNRPTRIDVAQGVDVRLFATTATNISGWQITAKQLQYSDLPSQAKSLELSAVIGTIETALFRENQSLIKLIIFGSRCDTVGSIMDFVNACKTLEELNLNTTKVIGLLSEFCEAAKDVVTVAHTLKLYISGSNDIINDLTSSRRILITFDGNGGYTAVDE